MKLFLDDERTAPDGWETIRPGDFKDFFTRNKNKIEAISFDHDLGYNENGEEYPSGYDFFCEFEKAYYEHDIIPPYMYVHSANPAGRGNILRGIESLNRRLGREYNPQVLPE